MVQQFILDEDDLKLILADHFDTMDNNVDMPKALQLVLIAH